MNTKKAKKIRQLYRREFRCISKDFIDYIYKNKRWYIPRFIIKIVLNIK